MKIKSKLLLGAAALMLSTAAAQADYKLTILHINDVHSRIEPINKYDSTCRASDNLAGSCFGGMARVKTAIDLRRNALNTAGANVLTLDAGDQFQGSLFYSTYKGSVAVDLMNKIGFDAMAVGNHEFDDGPEKLAEFATAAQFPILFANTDISKEPLLKDKIQSHIVKEIGGEKVAIIGVLAEDTAETSSPGKNIAFVQSEETLKQTVAELEAAGINKIVVLSHVGIERDKEIAAAVDGIDVIVGGHSHTLLDEYPTVVNAPNGKPVQIVQAYAYSKYLGELTVEFDDEGNVTKAKGAPWLLNAMVPEDEEFLAYIKEKGAPIEELKTKVIGSSTATIEGSRDICRQMECAMGNLVSDAMLDRVKSQGVTIAFQNSGGLRASIDEGELTMGEVLTVLPFQNTLATFEITGAGLLEALENGVSQYDKVAGRFPQVAGMTFTFNKDAEVGSRISDVMVQAADGTFGPIDANATYGVVTNNYVRQGGDGYNVFETKATAAYDYGPGLEQVVADYIAAKGGSYTPYTDGRIKSLNK
jgi:5'-nucleotidase